MTYIENAVRLAEVAKVTKRTATELEAEAPDLNLFLGEDWAGRPALAQRDARQLVTGEARRIREHEAKWAAHLADCQAWTAGRDDAVRLAHQKANTDDGRRGPEGVSYAREKAIEAGRHYERTTSMPLWNGEESGNASRSFTDRPGRLKRATSALVGTVR